MEQQIPSPSTSLSVRNDKQKDGNDLALFCADLGEAFEDGFLEGDAVVGVGVVGGDVGGGDLGVA